MEPDDLPAEALLLLFEALTDPDKVPSVVSDPAVRQQLRALGLGRYVADARECASRRVDLRRPEDLHDEPLALDEAPEGVEAVVLSFDRA